MGKLKSKKARTKGVFTRARTRLLMSMEGGLSLKVKVMENLDHLAIAFENVIGACARLQLYYEAAADMEKLKAVSCEVEAMEQDFHETEQLVKRYLNGSRKKYFKYFRIRTHRTVTENRAEPIFERKIYKMRLPNGKRNSIESHRILNGRTANAKRNFIRDLWNIISSQESEVSRHWVLLVNKVNK